jgi:hypothetical protein
MADSVSELFEEALGLSEESRLELAERLIESAPPSSEIQQEQIRIATSRMSALDTGLSVEIPGEEAHATVMRAISLKP